MKADVGRALFRWLPRLRRRHPLLFVLLAFLPIAALTVVALVLGSRVRQLEALGYVGVLVINLLGSGTFVLPIPGVAASFIAGGLLNPFLVGVASATGATLGELTGYLAGAGSSVLLERYRGPWRARIEGWMHRRGALTVFIFAAVPNPFFDFIGLAAGSLGYPVTRFLLACWLGKLVKFVLVALAGFWGLEALMRLLDL